MCFLPYSRASMDQIPGPIIATAAPIPASMTAVSELPNDAEKTQTSTMAITIPARGVQRPRSRNTAETAATRCGRFGANLEVSRRCVAPQ